MEAYRKIKDSIVYRSKPLHIEVDASEDNEIDLLRAALDMAADNGTAQVLQNNMLENLPCCSGCGNFRLREPTRKEHRKKHVRLQSPFETARKKSGTCADLCVYNVAIQNAKHALGQAEKTACVELIPHAQGPGMHHTVVVKSCGSVSDPAEKAKRNFGG